MNTRKLKRNIMARIYLIFAIRKLKNPLFLKLAGLTLLLTITSFLVSLGNVIANMPSDPIGLYNFGTTAFWNTGISVKAMILLSTVVVALLVKDVPDYLKMIPKPKLIWRT